MDWLTFIATMTGHVMWPLVIIVLLILVRKHIGALAERIEEFSFGGAKFIWRKKLEQGAIIIDHEPKPELTGPTVQPAPKLDRPPEPRAQTGDDKRAKIAKEFAHRREMRREYLSSSSFGRVLSGLDEVDRILFEIADRMGFDPASASSVMYSLLAHGNVPPSIGKLYETLRDARNLIARSGTLPDEKETEEYLRQTHFLQGALANLKDMMPTPSERGQVE
jgi:hypothetical protein